MDITIGWNEECPLVLNKGIDQRKATITDREYDEMIQTLKRYSDLQRRLRDLYGRHG